MLPSAAPPTSNATRTPTASPIPTVVDDDLVVDANGRTLHMTCLGEGAPTILLEAGHPSAGLQQFLGFGRAFTDLLARERRVCAYDRAGYGRSDPAPDEPRDLDDVTDDLRAALAAAGIDGPLVLVGSSFGGMVVTYYANRFPAGVEGVVLLDVPAPSATLSLQELPEVAWDHPSNREHVDVIPEFEHRLAKERFPFEAPLLVITATNGQSTIEDQAFWLDWSATSSQIEVEGGHSVYEDSPQSVSAAVLEVGSP